MVCTWPAGGAFCGVGALLPFTGMSALVGGGADVVKSASGSGSMQPSAIGMMAVMCVSGPYSLMPRPSLSLAAFILRRPSK
eukprot:3742722-Amphidinium_carterae.1